MGNYTEILDYNAENLLLEEDDYKEKLLQIATLFRGFGEAFTEFMVKHGYSGAIDDVDAKAKFLRDKYKQKGIKPPRDFKEWFLPMKNVKRKTIYPICFAFDLNLSETEELFRCVQFERSLDCHTINEAVYYFCIKNQLPYSIAEDIISKIPKIKKNETLPKQEILYTGTIVEYINSISDSEKLIRYIIDNLHVFEYNNATAIKYIQKLWLEISKNDGLATQEGQLIDKAKNQYQDRSKKGDTDNRLKEVIETETKREDELKLDDYVISEDGASTWTIFSQIIGLDNKNEKKFAIQYDRQISSVLKDSTLLPLNASYAFPSQHSIDRLLRGELNVDNELIRKMLIFLVFYTYWAKKIIKNKNIFYEATISDSEGCLDTINAYLTDAGYPELYVGNPYDWLFRWALNDINPLEAFRFYMSEILTINEEQADSEEQ